MNKVTFLAAMKGLHALCNENSLEKVHAFIKNILEVYETKRKDKSHG